MVSLLLVFKLPFTLKKPKGGRWEGCGEGEEKPRMWSLLPSLTAKNFSNTFLLEMKVSQLKTKPKEQNT